MPDKNFILSAFPENYRLYEHIRTKASTTNGPNKSHAAGGNDRQDSYLYGHPQGRKKRYRSPADYFPHLLWLSTDESGDPNNCCCRICSPEELELEDEAPAKVLAKAQVPNKPVATPSNATTATTANAARAPGQPAANISLPRVRNYEQKLDSQYNAFFYRPGEVVWFQRGQAWGLGTIANRFKRSGQQVGSFTYRYRVQPLGNPFGYPQPVDCSQDQIRNWLAWSPPPCVRPSLNPTPANGMKQATFDTTNWREYSQDPKTSSTDAEVDSSILAAKMLETTYTPFDLAESKTSTGASLQVSERSYNGIYLGAEKIWLGDPLRLRGKDNGATTDIMILHKILERQDPGNSSNSAVLLIGDIYSPVTVPTNTLAPTSPLHPSVLFPTLPVRLRTDLSNRNTLAASSLNPSIRTQTSTLKLTTPSAHKTFSDIKGRWYESSLLMPVLNPAAYEAQKRNGELADCGLWMNGHGDCNKPLSNEPQYRPASVRCKKREEAFGSSVPRNFSIVTHEKEPEMQAQPARPTSAGSGAGGRASQGQTQAQGQGQGQAQQPRQSSATQAPNTALSQITKQAQQGQALNAQPRSYPLNQAVPNTGQQNQPQQQEQAQKQPFTLSVPKTQQTQQQEQHSLQQRLYQQSLQLGQGQRQVSQGQTQTQQAPAETTTFDDLMDYDADGGADGHFDAAMGGL